MRKIFVVAVAGCALLCRPAHSLAQSSTNTVTYQGVLTQNGTPVPDGTQTLVFKIYDAATGGTLIETISVPDVQTTQGRFAAAVPVAPSSFSGADRWWSVTFSGTELPRQKVTATPYSVTAISGPSTQPFTTTQIVSAYTPGDAVATTGTARFQMFDRGGVSTVYANWKAAAGSLVGLFPVLVDVDGIDRLSVNGRGQATSRADLAGLANTAGAHFYLDSDGQRVDLAINYKGTNITENELYPLYVTTPSSGLTFAVTAGGHTFTRVLSITGADLAEKFDIAPAQKAAENGTKPIPGMVVSIDPKNPGKLMVASAAYDKKVAGVISGANGLDAGVILGKGNPNPLIDGEHPVAMTGRVWVYVDESAPGSKIEPGDRLTTSGTKPGYAMKVTDPALADGAVIGKAMTGVDPKTGMALVLVNLQ